MWCAGKNIVCHYSGLSLNEIMVPIPSQGIQFVDIEGFKSDDISIVGISKDIIPPIDSTVPLLYHYDGQTLFIEDTTIESSTSRLKFGYGLAVIDGALYSAGRGVFKRVDGKWNSILSHPLITRIYGTSVDNIFAAGELGIIYHYNGSDWQRIIPINEFYHLILGIWSDDREVFFLAVDNNKTYIIHGK